MPAFQDPEVYRDILHGLQIGVSVLDLQNRIVFWSDGAEQITGYARIEVLGHACTDNILQHCNQVSCEMCDDKCPIAAALHESRAIEATGFVHHKSGHRTPVRAWAIPLRAKNGSIIGVIQTFEGQFNTAESDPNEHSLKHGGWLDEITGLPNLAIMHSHLRETLGTFTEMHVPFCIVLLDFPELDHFRARYGQGASRAIVHGLARTLRNTVWPTDFVGQWDDGQFLVILMGCDEQALHAISARMQRMMAGATIMWWGEELSLRVALGRASAQNGDSLETLLQRARLSLQQSRGELSATAAPGAD